MKKTASDTEQVTTEPQRIALEAMSRDLVQKLNVMVAEQEARAREFAAQQHSLSATPAQPTPQVTRRPQQVTPTPHHRQHTPVVRPVVPQTPVYTPEPEPELPPPPPQYFPPIPNTPKPTIIRKKKKEEEGVGATAVIVFIVVLVLILTKGCS